MNTETITYLKENAKPAFVIQSIENYEYQKETLALLKLIQLSEKSLEEGEYSLDEAFEQFV
jgi:PHD/YefM family antitoxin component YafN of YafNO toxin-antitoxin module